MINLRPKVDYLSWLGVFLIVFIAVQPLWGSPVKGDDTWLHFYRIASVNALWDAGIVHSGWSPNLILGYGYPLFNFYPPLGAYLLTGLYWLLGQNALWALNVGFGIALALSALHMFLLGRHLFGAAAGVGMAAIYTLSPVILDQTYGRGSLSNALALAIIPIALLFLVRVVEEPVWRWVGWTALAVAGISFSHIAVSILFVGPLLVLGTTYAVLKNGRRVCHVWLAVALGLALSASVWLPALGEIYLTHYAAAASKVDFADHWAEFVSRPQPIIAGLNNSHIPKQVGFIPLFLGVFGAGLGAWRRRQPADKFSFVSGCLGLGVAWLTTSTSIWLWQQLDLLHKLQFPWRLLDIAIFCLTVAAGSFFALRRRLPIGLVFRAGSSVALIILFWQALPYLYPPRLTQLPRQPTLADVQAVQLKYGIWGLTAWGEYASQSVRHWPATPPFPGAAEGATLAMKLRQVALPPDALVQAEGTPLRARLQVDLPQAATIVFDTHYFPGWRATVDDVETSVAPDEEGMLTVPVAAGKHLVTVWFGRTPIRVVADSVTLLAVTIVLIITWRRPTLPRQLDAYDPPSDRANLKLLVITLVLLLTAKIVILDRFNTCLVKHPGADAIPTIATPVYGDFGEIALIGYELQAPDQLTLYWSAQEMPTRVYEVLVRLADGRGVPIKEIVNPHPGENVTLTWEAGVLTRDHYTLPLAQGIRPIGYQLSVELLDSTTGEPLSLQDSPGQSATTVPIPSTSRLLKLPPAEQMPEAIATHPQWERVGAVFGEAIELSHSELTFDNGSLYLTLVWQATGQLPSDYTVFIHILKPDGSLAATGDGQPADGVYPTSYWEPGEIIVDEHAIPLDLPAGEYTVQVGLYLLESGERLSSSELQSGLPDSVVIGTLSIAP